MHMHDLSIWVESANCLAIFQWKFCWLTIITKSRVKLFILFQSWSFCTCQSVAYILFSCSKLYRPSKQREILPIVENMSTPSYNPSLNSSPFNVCDHSPLKLMCILFSELMYIYILCHLISAAVWMWIATILLGLLLHHTSCVTSHSRL